MSLSTSSEDTITQTPRVLYYTPNSTRFCKQLALALEPRLKGEEDTKWEMRLGKDGKNKFTVLLPVPLLVYIEELDERKKANAID